MQAYIFFNYKAYTTFDKHDYSTYKITSFVGSRDLGHRLLFKVSKDELSMVNEAGNCEVGCASS